MKPTAPTPSRSPLPPRPASVAPTPPRSPLPSRAGSVAPTPPRSPLPPHPTSVAPTPLRTPVPPRPAAAPITLPSTPVAMYGADASAVPPGAPPSLLWRDWYVYQADGRHIGPLSTDTLARAWLNRQVPQGACVGAAGDGRWWPVEAVTEVMEAARAIQSAPASFASR